MIKKKVEREVKMD